MAKLQTNHHAFGQLCMGEVLNLEKAQQRKEIEVASIQLRNPPHIELSSPGEGCTIYQIQAKLLTQTL